LFGQLAELGINVESIIKISSQDYNRFEKKDEVAVKFSYRIKKYDTEFPTVCRLVKHLI
jgi:hypothetical protein